MSLCTLKSTLFVEELLQPKACDLKQNSSSTLINRGMITTITPAHSAYSASMNDAESDSLSSTRLAHGAFGNLPEALDCVE